MTDETTTASRRARAARTALALLFASLLGGGLPPGLAAAPQGPSPQATAEAPPDERVAGGSGPAADSPDAGAPAASPVVKTKEEIYILADQLQRQLAEATVQEPRTEELDGLIRDGNKLLVEADDAQASSDLPQLEAVRDRLLEASGRLYELLRSEPEVAPDATAEAEGGSGEKPSTGPAEPESDAAPPAVPPDPEVPGSPPRALRDAARAYFAGRYQEALDLLGAAAFSAPRSQALALLLRAAARYSLYLTAGEEDSAALAAVRADLGECRRLAPDLAPDPELFSPRFVRFFSQRG